LYFRENHYVSDNENILYFRVHHYVIDNKSILYFRVHHYVIEKQTDGTYMIPSGKKFSGPIELIYHHQSQKDGIVTLLTVGCNRHPSQAPVAFRGMTYSDLEHELIRKANSIKVKLCFCNIPFFCKIFENLLVKVFLHGYINLFSFLSGMYNAV
jgi:hypothetical protein